jgi:hypothetical protein
MTSRSRDKLAGQGASHRHEYSLARRGFDPAAVESGDNPARDGIVLGNTQERGAIGR